MPTHFSLIYVSNDPSKAAQDAHMTQMISPRPSRRAPIAAILLFGLAYIGVLVIIFAPEGSLSSRNSTATLTQDQ
jgi:hypothetical protein